jgi:1,2-dihydroxy-3-keto-5-methylthiopentene dioxygenase
MTLLTVWPDDDTDTVLHRTTDEAEIRSLLAPLGVGFQRWAPADVPAGAGPDELLAAYRGEVDRLRTAEGYGHVDVMVSSEADGPQATAEAREGSRAEHTHDDTTARFFTRGAGVFYLHLQRKVHAVLCEAGDLLSVPARATHWYDAGAAPDFAAIRFSRDGNWAGVVTGSPISALFPDFDDLMTGHRPAAVG